MRENHAWCGQVGRRSCREDGIVPNVDESHGSWERLHVARHAGDKELARNPRLHGPSAAQSPSVLERQLIIHLQSHRLSNM